MIELARDALYAAGIGRGTLAARLLELAVGGASGAAEVFVMERFRLCALLEASESGLRYAIRTLAAAGLVAPVAAPRGLVRFALRLGLRTHQVDDRPVQRELFAKSSPEVNHGEHGGHGAGGEAEGLVALPLTVDPVSVFSVPSVVNQESEPGVVENAQRTVSGLRSADAQRNCAARSRDVAAQPVPASPTAGGAGKQPRVSKVVEASDLESLTARWPSLMEPAGDALAREVHSSIPIPPFPPPLAKARYSPGNREDAKVRKREGEETDGSFATSRFRDPAGGNVEKSARAGIADPQGGKIAAWREQILRRVKIDARYGWTAWSAALMAVEGPISEAVLAGCIEGAHGHGGKFVNAVKARLAECDVGKLKQLTLWDDVTRTVQLHRFTHLRPALARHGIQLDDGATRLVRTARQTARRA